MDVHRKLNICKSQPHPGLWLILIITNKINVGAVNSLPIIGLIVYFCHTMRPKNSLNGSPFTSK